MDQPVEVPTRLVRPWILTLVIAIVAMLPFTASVGGSFIYDDFMLVVGNELVRELRIAELWSTEFFHNAKALHFQYFRPLVTTSWALDWALFGGHPAGFHATNLAIHAIVACLVFGTLRRWSGRDGAALLATLVWAWHPTKTEAVVWISGRTDLLCTLGLLVAIAGTGRRLRKVRWGLPLEALGILLAFTAKESAVVLPGLVAVEAWVHQGRPSLDLRVVGRAIAKALPHGAIGALYLLARAFVLPIEPKDFGYPQSLRDTTLFAFETWGELAKTLFWPWPLTMHRAPIHIDEAKNFIHDPVRLGLGLAIVVLLFATTFAFAKKRPMVVVGLLLAAFLFLPVANLRPTRMPWLFAERFVYLPSLGLALALVGLLPKWRGLRGPIALGVSFAALFASVTACALHTENLLDERRFWAHELDVHPYLPTALRPAFRDAFAERRYDDALELAARGYRGAKAWTISHPFDIEFALDAAQVVEARTLDSDRASLDRLAEFFQAFFLAKQRARLDAPSQTFVVDGSKLSAKWLREVAPGTFAGFQAVGARALARAARCDEALALAKDARVLLDDPAATTTTALVFARCGAWDDALALVTTLPEGPVRGELDANLRASREALARLGEAHDIDSALLRSRIGAMLLDRRMAFTALRPHEDELVADPQGAVYFARAAWAAGEDDAAKQALLRWMPTEARDEQLTAWSRELGRN